MPRKSLKAIQAEAALANLTCLHDLAIEAEQNGERRAVVYIGNASSANRYLETLQAGGLPLPEFMHKAGLPYFRTIWSFKS